MEGEGHYRTVSKPRDMDPTNFNVETVLPAMISGRQALCQRKEMGVCGKMCCWSSSDDVGSREVASN